MPIREIIARGTFDAAEISILMEAFDVALGLARIERASPQGALLAQRVIHIFEGGEREPKTIGELAAGKPK